MIEANWGMLLFLAGFAVAMILGRRYVASQGQIELRPIAAFEHLPQLLARAIETGRRLHLALGVGGITGQQTADSLAGLEVLESVGGQSKAAGLSPLVTMADPTLLLVAQDVMARPGPGEEYETRPAGDLRWLGPQSTAYAAGVMGIIGSEGVESNIMAGSSGDEYLLMGSAANRQQSGLITAASDPTVLPFVLATADDMVMGEEMYAAGAYLSKKPWHIGSLLAQDWMRWIIVLLIIGVVIANSVL